MKTKRFLTIIVIALSITLTAGCSSEEVKDYAQEFLAEDQVTAEEGLKDYEPPILVVEETEEILAGEEENTENTKDPMQAVEDQSGYYAYQLLSEADRALYVELLTIIVNMEEDSKVSSLDAEQIDRVFEYVLIDHPEIFYVSGYTTTKRTRNGILEEILFSGIYLMDQEQRAQKEIVIEESVNTCLAGIAEGASDYEKIKYVYEYLVQHTEYDRTAEDNQNICSVFINGRSVCQGYAKATQYLLNRLGLFCTLVEGMVKGSEPHVWNLVKIEDQYYYVDTTWGDASYSLTGSEEIAESMTYAPEINYDYLCITDKMLLRTHVIDSAIILPQCNSMDYNYYVQEGVYFEKCDEEKIAKLFADAYSEGDSSILIKCADENVYYLIRQYLLEDQNIFEYLNGSQSANYLELSEQLSFIFYL